MSSTVGQMQDTFEANSLFDKSSWFSIFLTNEAQKLPETMIDKSQAVPNKPYHLWKGYNKATERVCVSGYMPRLDFELLFPSHTNVKY